MLKTNTHKKLELRGLKADFLLIPNSKSERERERDRESEGERETGRKREG